MIGSSLQVLVTLLFRNLNFFWREFSFQFQCYQMSFMAAYIDTTVTTTSTAINIGHSIFRFILVFLWMLTYQDSILRVLFATPSSALVHNPFRWKKTTSKKPTSLKSWIEEIPIIQWNEMFWLSLITYKNVKKPKGPSQLYEVTAGISE